MGFPALEADLDTPNYPGVQLKLNLNLSRDEISIIQAHGQDGDAIRSLTIRLEADLKRLAVPDITDDERAELVAKIDTLGADIEAAKTAARQQYGALLAKAYCNRVYDAYGEKLDFTTGETALATLANAQLPEVFVTWLEYAPALGLTEVSTHTLKKSRTSSAVRTLR